MRKRKEYEVIFHKKAKNNNLLGNLIIKYDKTPSQGFIEGVREVEIIRHNKPWSMEQ